jgi:predicted ATPase
MASRFAKEAEAQPEYVAMQYAEGGELCESVRWWQNAGRRAVAHAAFAEAAAHYERGLALLRTVPPSTERDQRELELQVELGYALIPVRGWSAAETATAFKRAGDLCDAIGETPAHFRARWGLGAFHLVRGDQHRARRVAEQCAAAARRSNDVDARMEAHLLCGIVACVTGEFAAGLRDLDACVRLYGPEPREAHRVLYGQDPKASALGWMAMAQWACGRPDEALATAEGALAFLRGARQPFLLARGLAALGFVHVFREEPQGPGSPLADAVALCAEQGFKYFHAVVSAFHGASLVHAGRVDDGIATMRANVEALRAIGSELLLTLVFANLAAAHLALGQATAGLAAVDEGLACVERNGERWAEAELHRLRGRLLLARAVPDAAAAAACFRKALEIARAQGTKAYELRAAADLSDLGASRGRRHPAAAVAAAR